MSVESVVRRLSVPAAGFEVRGRGHGGLTQAEMAGALAGCRDEVVWFFYAKYLGDVDAGRRLYAWQHLRLSDRSRVEGWKVERGSEACGRLARTVVAFALLSGAVPSMREKAEFFGCAVSNWSRTWEDRYATALGEVLDLDWLASRAVRRNLFIGVAGLASPSRP